MSARVLFVLLCFMLPGVLYAGVPGMAFGELKALVQSNGVYISWQTFNEEKPVFFVLEKTMDGKHWGECHRVRARGYTRSQQDYHYSDAFEGKALAYRLLADDGYNNIPLDTVDIPQGLPAFFAEGMMDTRSRMLALDYRIDRKAEIILRVYNSIGQQVYTSILPTENAGTFQVAVDFSSFSKGVYLVAFTHVQTDRDLGRLRVENLGSNYFCRMTLPHQNSYSSSQSRAAGLPTKN